MKIQINNLEALERLIREMVTKRIRESLNLH